MLIFVSVEFPDEDLVALLATYGELKSCRLRHLYFPEEGFKHIENGVRVATFTKITRAIPKRIVIAGLEIEFKYSGQPATCYRCQSTEHMVKNCPKREVSQKKPAETTRDIPHAETTTSEPQGMDTAPHYLHNQTPSPTLPLQQTPLTLLKLGKTNHKFDNGIFST